MTQSNSRILMIVENRYPHDIRVRKEATSLTDAGYLVSVIALGAAGQKAHEEINGVNIYRIPEINIFEKTNKNDAKFVSILLGKLTTIAGYMIEYSYFTMLSFLVSLYVLAKHGFDVIHTHNPPDTLAVIGIFYRLLGKHYVFDHHDLAPELYLTRVSGRRDLIYRALVFFERLSCRYSNIVISTNESYTRIEKERHSIDTEKTFIVRNNPIVKDCSIDGDGGSCCKPAPEKKTLLFLGSINPQDGVDILLKAIHYLVYRLNEKNFTCNIVGDGDSLASSKQLSSEMGLTEYVDFKGLITDRRKVKEYLSSTDIGVEPAPCNAANEHSTFIKVMEFMAAGKPLVAFDLKETRYSADGAAMFVRPGDIEGFAAAIQHLLNEPDARRTMGQAGFNRIQDELNWEKASEALINAYSELRKVR